MNWSITLAEHGVLPDALVRAGMRRLLRRRLSEVESEVAGVRDPAAAFLEAREQTVIAEHTDLANRQHYEVPTALFKLMLGERMKYSACYYPATETDLDEAERVMLDLTCEHAELNDGMTLLELGCGWGSLTLWMAEKYRGSRITAVSNSRTQQDYITGEADRRGLDNVTVICSDVNALHLDDRFDRIVSVEMFEHVRNYRELFKRLERWLTPEGKLFVHVFSHRKYPYLFEQEGEDDWMGRYFFSGGTMPSHDLLPAVSAAFRAEETWQINGLHYSRTLEDWLKKLDANRDAARAICAQTYGGGEAGVWLQRWRMFMMACSELFAYRGGTEWGVSHYRFVKQPAEAPGASTRVG